jgi:hypothetical protein
MNAATKKTFDYPTDNIDGAYGEEYVRLLLRATDWKKPDHSYPDNVVDRFSPTLGYLRLIRDAAGQFSRWYMTANKEVFDRLATHVTGEQFLTCSAMANLCKLPGFELSTRDKNAARQRVGERQKDGNPQYFDILLDRTNPAYEKFLDRLLVKVVLGKADSIKLEIKNDLRTHESGNIFAELTYKGNESGIAGQEGSCGWWVYTLTNPSGEIVAAFGITSAEFARITENWRRFSGKGAIGGGQRATGVKVPAMELLRENPSADAVEPLNFMIVEDAEEKRIK